MTKAFNLIDNGNKWFYIDDECRDHEISKAEATAKVLEKKNTVKVEGIECLYPSYTTIHAFISPAGAVSFPNHRDSCALKLLCIEGIKGFVVDDIEYIIKEGCYKKIIPNQIHRANNIHDSIILSIEK